MQRHEFQPDPRLRGDVAVIWQVEETHRPGEAEHRFLPERSVRLMFSSGASWRSAPDGAALERLPGAALFGLTLEPLRVVSRGLTRALGVEFFPWGARRLLGWEAGGRGLEGVSGHARLTREVAALLDLGGWTAARELVQDWLLALWQARTPEAGAGVQAATRLYQSLGAARVGALAEELDLSERQLERRFAQEVGVPAKTLARLIRFEEVHHRLWQAPQTPLAPLAYELGFSDQAHLTREFKALSHMTPRGFSAMTLRRLYRLQSPGLLEDPHLLQPDVPVGWEAYARGPGDDLGTAQER